MEDLPGQVLPSTTAQTGETLDKTQETLNDILKALQEQGKHLSTVAEHLIKLQLAKVAQDVVEEPEMLAGDVVEAGKDIASTGISAAQIPPDVVEDVLEDTDKGLKEIKPRKKSLFKK